MRTTVDLPPATHRRVSELAKARGVSLSAVVAELTTRGLAQLGEPVVISTDEVSGLPVLSVGRRVTVDEVERLIEEE